MREKMISRSQSNKPINLFLIFQDISSECVCVCLCLYFTIPTTTTTTTTLSPNLIEFLFPINVFSYILLFGKCTRQTVKSAALRNLRSTT